MKIVCNVDRTPHKEKPAGQQIAIIQTESAKPEEIDVQSLFNIILSGGTFRPAAINGNSDKGFLSQQIIAIDIDNSTDKKPIEPADRIAPEQAISRAEKKGLHVNFCYPTFSDSKALRKYRLLFLLDVPIYDRALRDRIADFMAGLYNPAADSKCTNPSRLFFGTDRAAILEDTDHINSLDSIISLLPDEVPKKKPQKATEPRKRGTLYTKPCTPHKNGNIGLIRQGNVEELRKRLGHKKTKVFDNTEDFLKYVYSLDVGELLEVGTPKSFSCIFHTDNSPSASIFTTESGNQCYHCFSCGVTMNIKQIIEELINATSEYKSLEFIKAIYNLSVKETSWSIEQKANIDSIINCMTSTAGNGFTDICPTAAKTTRNASYIYLTILNIAKNNIRPEKVSDENIVFPMSIRQLAKATGKSSIDKVSKYVKMLLFHEMLEIVPDEKLPEEVLRIANAKRTGEKHCHTNFYQIPSWVYKRTQLIEKQGQRWKNQNYRLNGISYELFYRNESPEMALKLFPQTATYTTKAGEQIQKNTTKRADDLTLLLSDILLHQIEKSGYTTEAAVITEAGRRKGYKLAEIQLKRSVNEILDTYSLEKIRANKITKEKYGIDTKGYPLIIIHTEEKGER